MRSKYILYHIAYLFIVITYAFVTYHSFGLPKASMQYLQNILLDENTQHLILSLYFLFSKAVTITLLPFAIFSFFHTIDYACVHLFTTFFSEPSMRSHDSKSLPVRLNQTLINLVHSNHKNAIIFVSYLEVAIAIRLVLGALVFRNSLVAVAFYAHFLRMRYLMSPQTRSAFNHIGDRLDSLLSPSKDSSLTGKIYSQAKYVMSRYCESTALQFQAIKPGQ
ncbi:uncharacterized protein VTP21DRAFT_4356 [Calcarisporiella thermophila]|uniref:uncharacterized protein n=1 Tax=Calcarisporiella thermophila TaxID=911321 RepID=UPI003743B13B